MTSRRATRRRSGALVRPSRSAAELAGEAELARQQGAQERGPVRLWLGNTAEREELARLQAEALASPVYPGAGWGWTADRCRLAEVSAELQRGLVPRVGDCYRTSFQFVVDHHDQPGLRLLHGWVWEPAEPGGGIVLPWPHSWVEWDGRDAVMDPACGRWLNRSDFYLGLVAMPLAVYTPAQAIRRASETGFSDGKWPEGDVAHAELEARMLAAIDARVPGLLAWAGRMLECDPVFAGSWRGHVQANSILSIHMLLGLAQHPQRWRTHRPGSRRWPWPVYPAPNLAIHLP